MRRHQASALVPVLELNAEGKSGGAWQQMSLQMKSVLGEASDDEDEDEVRRCRSALSNPR